MLPVVQFICQNIAILIGIHAWWVNSGAISSLSFFRNKISAKTVRLASPIQIIDWLFIIIFKYQNLCRISVLFSFWKGNDRSFIQKSHAAHRNNPHYGVPKISSASEFLIVHFAGIIAYSVSLLVNLQIKMVRSHQFSAFFSFPSFDYSCKRVFEWLSYAF